MRILFNHLHKTGGLTVCHHLKEIYGNKIFLIDPHSPNRSIRQFAESPEKVRHSYTAIAGHDAIVLSRFAHPKMIATTVLRDPVERVISLYRFCLMHPDEFLHPICKTRSLARCVNEIPEFSNYYADKFDRRQYHIASTTPGELLRTIGYFGNVETINRSDPHPVTDEDIAAVVAGNQIDIAIFNEVKANPGRLPIRDQKTHSRPADTTQTQPLDAKNAVPR